MSIRVRMDGWVFTYPALEEGPGMPACTPAHMHAHASTRTSMCMPVRVLGAISRRRGLYSHAIYTYGLCSYGLYSYGIYSYGSGQLGMWSDV